MESFVIEWSVLLLSGVFCDGVECFGIEVECSVTEWSLLL